MWNRTALGLFTVYGRAFRQGPTASQSWLGNNRAQKKLVTQVEATTARETSNAEQIIDNVEASQRLRLADVHRMERVFEKPTPEAATGTTVQLIDRPSP
jgi:hypothetical protein